MIRYRAGYKYQLAETYVARVPILGYAGETPWLSLDAEGMLTIRAGYAWDGPSGPTLDTASMMRGSLIHDALYQLLRLGHLPASVRWLADEVYFEAVLADGLALARRSRWAPIRVARRAFVRARAAAHYQALRVFGAAAGSAAAVKPVLTAP